MRDDVDRRELPVTAVWVSRLLGLAALLLGLVFQRSAGAVWEVTGLDEWRSDEWFARRWGWVLAALAIVWLVRPRARWPKLLALGAFLAAIVVPTYAYDAAHTVNGVWVTDMRMIELSRPAATALVCGVAGLLLASIAVWRHGQTFGAGDPWQRTALRLAGACLLVLVLALALDAYAYSRFETGW